MYFIKNWIKAIKICLLIYECSIEQGSPPFESFRITVGITSIKIKR